MVTSILTPQQLGRIWEKEWADAIGAKMVKGSGNQWHSKLDVRGRKITWSNKYTGNDSFSVTKPLIDEFVRATMGPGASGFDRMGALAVRTAQFEVVVMRADDFIQLVKEESPIISAEKADARRAAARVPLLLREREDG